MILLVTVWILLLAGSYFIFIVIVPLDDFPGPLGGLMTAIVKVSSSGALAILWIYSLVKLRNIIVARKLFANNEPSERHTPSSSKAA